MAEFNARVEAASRRKTIAEQGARAAIASAFGDDGLKAFDQAFPLRPDKPPEKSKVRKWIEECQKLGLKAGALNPESF